MWTANFVEEDGVGTVPLTGSLCGRREDRVGMLSESSHVVTGPLKQKLLFQICSARETTQISRAPLQHINVSIGV